MKKSLAIEWLLKFKNAARGIEENKKNTNNDANADQLALNVIKSALADGFDVNYQDDNDYCALAYAVESNRINCVKYLLAQKNIDTTLEVYESADNIGGIPLHIAAFRGYETIIELLVQKSPEDIDLEEYGGYTPLHETVINAQYPAFVLLLRLKADYEAKTGKDMSAIGVPKGMNTLQLIIHYAKADKNNTIYKDMWQYLVRLKLKNEEEITGNMLESDSDIDDSSDTSSENVYDFMFSNIEDPYLREAMRDYYREEGFDFDQQEEDYVSTKNLIHKSGREDFKETYNYETRRRNQDEQEGDDFTDSDSEEEKDYVLKPPVKIAENLSHITKGADLILSARGTHLSKNSVGFSERKNYVKRSATNLLTQYGLYSEDTHKRAKISYELLNEGNQAREQLLETANNATKIAVDKIKQEKNVTPILQKGSRASREQYDTRLDEFIQRYVNSYSTTKHDIENAQNKTKDDFKNYRTQSKQRALQEFKGIPFVSTSEDIGVGLNYAFAILNYDKKTTHEPSSDQMKAITLMPQYKPNGELKHPYLGVIFITLHTQDELSKNSIRTLDLFKNFKMDLQKVSPGSHESSGYIRALERVFFGGISKDNICLAKVVRLPDFIWEYRPFITEKYGLSKTEYSKYKKSLKTYGVINPNTQKMRNKQQFYRIQQQLIEHVITHERKALINRIQAWAKDQEIKVGSIDVNGNFSIDLDIDITEKVKTANEQRKKNMDIKNSSSVKNVIINNYLFNVVNVSADGNCLFHAIKNQLKLAGYHRDYSAPALRELCVRQLRTNKDKYVNYIEDDQTIEEHIEKISQDGKWGGELEIRALADTLNIQIHIYDNLHNITPSYNNQGTLKIFLFYNGINHYESLERATATSSSTPRVLK